MPRMKMILSPVCKLGTGAVIITLGSLLLGVPAVLANHKGSQGHAHSGTVDIDESTGHGIPGVPFQVYRGKGKAFSEREGSSIAEVDETIQTVVDALSQMAKDRTQYQRFDEALTKGVLQKVIVESQVFNGDGKEFMFLVARTKQIGQVKLLINASTLKERGFVNHPDQLVPVLAREFQWVVSKADTSKKRQPISAERDLEHVPIQTWKAIKSMIGTERRKNLQALFKGYLTTVDEYNSLQEQRYYDIGSVKSISGAQSDSTTKLYDIRVREALQQIVGEPHFLEQTPKAVRNLLNGKIWNVAFTHIDSRDWATRTRVVPKDKAIKVGTKGQLIQPGKILLNLHRTATPEDPYYAFTEDLPMGALSKDQLAQVIALEIENQIIEKSMRGHVAEDARTLPK